MNAKDSEDKTMIIDIVSYEWICDIQNDQENHVAIEEPTATLERNYRKVF